MSKEEKTFGHKTSERRACYHAFYAGCLLACFGIYSGSQLSDLAFLIGAVTTPLMWYAGARTLKKIKGGKDVDEPRQELEANR